MEYERKRKVLKNQMKELKKKVELEEQLRQDYKVYYGRESTLYQTQNELVNQINYMINMIEYILGR